MQQFYCEKYENDFRTQETARPFGALERAVQQKTGEVHFGLHRFFVRRRLTAVYFRIAAAPELNSTYHCEFAR